MDLCAYKIQHGLQSVDFEPHSLFANLSQPTSTPLKRKSDSISGSQPDDGEIGSDEEFGWVDDEPFNVPTFAGQLA